MSDPVKSLRPTKRKEIKKRVFGFDIETYDDNKKFYCATLYSEDIKTNTKIKPINYDDIITLKNGKYRHKTINNIYYNHCSCGQYKTIESRYCYTCTNETKNIYSQVFYDKRSLIDELKTKKFENSYIIATNLSFDFLGTFFNEDEIKNFSYIFRGSDLITAKAYIHKGQFQKSRKIINADGKKQNCDGSIQFIDTMNYVKFSVEKWGQILNIPKLLTPVSLGRLPVNQEEKDELVTYNIRDAEISYKACKFMFDGFYKIGATPKITVASTSMSLFRNKYLKDVYYNHNKEELSELFNAYYGGRTEVFKRGKITNHNYYDINSLYPHVMRKPLPNPNTVRHNRMNDIFYINNYEGVAHVKVSCPKDINIPLLPYRHDNKLIFPTGNFSGWYSNIELRKALSIGYKIHYVYKNVYFKETCTPLKDFANDLYAQRLNYKNDNNPLELLTKLCLNSTYGKFGQMFTNRDNLIHKDNLTQKIISSCTDIDNVGDDYYRIVYDTEPPVFCFPEWALYITAYARLELYDLLVKHNPVYCDTDSIITKNEIATSKELGGLKLEMKIKDGYIIRPKFYLLTSVEGDEIIKIKGLNQSKKKDNVFGVHITVSCMIHDIKQQQTKYYYKKMTKFREALRRGYVPNQIIDVFKTLNLHDTKRVWDDDFNIDKISDSKPHNIREFQ